MTDAEARIEEILEAFQINLGEYEYEAVDEAIELREEITPYLIKLLEDILEDPESFSEDQDYVGHIYAVMLLAHFRETAAHKQIVELFSLPGDLPGKLFEDILTEELPMILFRTCGGNMEQIKSLVLNRDANEYCRGAAMRALTYAVAEGITPRQEVLAFFGGLFTGSEAEPHSAFWDFLAARIYELHPEGMLEQIRAGYESGLITGEFIGYKMFEEASELTVEDWLERVREQMQRRSMDDLHAAMSWWHCFQQPDQDWEEELRQSNQPVSLSKQAKKKKQARKKKKKMAKASRRGNR